MKSDFVADTVRSNAFFDQINDFTKRIGLTNYVKLLKANPQEGKPFKPAILFRLDKIAIQEANLMENLQGFLSRIQGMNKPIDISVNEQEAILGLSKKSISNFTQCQNLEHIICREALRYCLSPYLTLKIGNGTTYHKIQYLNAKYEIDLSTLHKDRVKYYYHPDMKQKDAADSIIFLKNQGLNVIEFAKLGVSHATYYRVSSDTQENKMAEKTVSHEDKSSTPKKGQ